MSESGTKNPSAGKGKVAEITREKPRGGRARTVAEMLPDIGRAAYRRFGFIQSAVVSRWAEIVGDRYAEVSTPESIRFPQGKRAEGVLTLSVSGAHAPMLQHVAPVIIERVNQFFGYSAVSRLSIKQGAAVKPRPKPPLPRVPIDLPVELGDSLRAIADPELRAVLESLAQGVATSNRMTRVHGDKK